MKIVVEHRYAAMITDRHISHKKCVPSRPPKVGASEGLGILKYLQFHVGLFHPAHGRLQANIVPIPDVM